MFLSDQGTDYLEIHWFPYISQILSPKIAPKVGAFLLHAFSTIRKFGQFWNLEFLKHMETNVFLGSLFLDLKGISFPLIGNCLLFSYQPQQKKSIFPLVI